MRFHIILDLLHLPYNPSYATKSADFNTKIVFSSNRPKFTNSAATRVVMQGKRPLQKLTSPRLVAYFVFG